MKKQTSRFLIASAAALGAFALSKALIASAPRAAKAVLAGEQTLIFAHRGGAALFPEHTMAAFSRAAELGVDGFEIDVRATADEQLIAFHDERLERTTDFTGRVADRSFAELQAADAGYHFIGLDGARNRRGRGDRIVSLRELLRAFPSMRLNIDLKDAPDTYEGSVAPAALWRAIEEAGATDRVIVASSYEEQLERFRLFAKESVAIAASESEVKRALLHFASATGHLYAPRADVFQLPIRERGIALDRAKLIRFLASLNLPVHYWVVDREQDMQQLIAKGARGIITDRPDLAVAALR